MIALQKEPLVSYALLKIIKKLKSFQNVRLQVRLNFGQNAHVLAIWLRPKIAMRGCACVWPKNPSQLTV